MLQQCFGYAKPATGGNESTGSLDGKMQLMMKALQRQEVKDVKMTAEELAEAARR
jgi:hypothetical protein